MKKDSITKFTFPKFLLKNRYFYSAPAVGGIKARTQLPVNHEQTVPGAANALQVFHHFQGRSFFFHLLINEPLQQNRDRVVILFLSQFVQLVDFSRNEFFVFVGVLEGL